jgi:hypothetical protein
MKALTMHMAAVLPTATAHSINLDDQYEEDITTERIPVIEGFSPVPDGVGLGFEVDDEAITRFAASSNTPLASRQPRIVGIIHMPGGQRIYGSRSPSLKEITGREEGTIRGINLERWADDDSVEFEETFNRVEKEGWFYA